MSNQQVASRWVWEKQMNLARISLYGRMGDVSTQLDRITSIGIQFGAKNVHILRPPASRKQYGWHQVVSGDEFANKGQMTFAEGGVLPGNGHCLMVPTRDCSVLYLENMSNCLSGATHVGRESVINREGFCGPENVIDSLLQKLQVQDGKKVRAYITGGISAKNFPHDDPEFVRPFIERYGERAVPDVDRLTLDMNYVITESLLRWGVPRENIHLDGLCSFDEPNLGSRRANKPEQNWVFVWQSKLKR